MSWSINRNAILMARAAGSGSNVPIAERYFVPQAAKDQYTVDAKSDPKFWVSGAGSAEMSLQKWELVTVITAEFNPETIYYPFSFGHRVINASIKYTISNGNEDTGVLVEYSFPGDLIPYADHMWGNLNLSASQTSGSIFIPALGSAEIEWNLSVSVDDFDSGEFKKVVIPGAFFVIDGEPYPSVIEAIGNWAFGGPA